jgi:hypothetical protein
MSWAWWPVPIVLAMWEAEGRKITVQACLGKKKKISETLPEK